jgi:hypothetical protein
MIRALSRARQKHLVSIDMRTVPERGNGFPSGRSAATVSVTQARMDDPKVRWDTPAVSLH